jgi:hypothetical protein
MEISLSNENFFKIFIKNYDIKYTQQLLLYHEKIGELKSTESITTNVLNEIKKKFVEIESKKKTFKSKEITLTKFNIDKLPKSLLSLKEIYDFYRVNTSTYKKDLVQIKANINLLDTMNSSIDESALSTDIIEELNQTVNPLLQKRLDDKVCGFRRPGRNPFPCDGELVEGTIYCKDHLKEYEPLKYVDIFKED